MKILDLENLFEYDLMCIISPFLLITFLQYQLRNGIFKNKASSLILPYYLQRVSQHLVQPFQ
jgi:hypothetical protein